MTNVNTEHPNHIPCIEIVEEGREISFRKDCFGKVEIYRKVNSKDWELLIKEVRTPYIDEEKFPSGTKLKYFIKIEESSEKRQYELDVWL